MATQVFACRANETVFEPSADELAALMEDPSVFVWVSLDQAGPDQRTLLTDVFQLHELLVEDALGIAPTPKLEVHDSYLYWVLHGLDPDNEKELVTVDVDFFVGETFLITHHRTILPSLIQVRAEIDRDPTLLQKGPSFVAHRLADLMVDEFLPMMAHLNEEIVRLEEAVMSDAGPTLLSQIFAAKHILQRLHRVGLHQQHVLHHLAQVHLAKIPKEARPFFRDIEDHFIRVMDLNEGYRELLSASSEAYLSMQSHRLNEVMKILTVISTIMLPLTFITGLYGMNFDSMPLIHWRYGFEGLACRDGTYRTFRFSLDETKKMDLKPTHNGQT